MLGDFFYLKGLSVKTAPFFFILINYYLNPKLMLIM